MSNVVSLVSRSAMSNAYGDWLRECGCGPSTIHQRVEFFERIVREWGSPNPKVRVMVEWLEQHHGWTRRTYLANLTSIHRWMLETEKIERLPLERYRRPREPRPRPHPLSVQELNDALATDDRRLRTWLLLGSLAGLRAHEIAKVHGRDVDEYGLFVRGKGGDESTVPTHPAIWELAQQYPRNDYWFPSPHDSRAHVGGDLVSLRIRERLREVGVEHGATHRLRYTYATRLADAGTPIRVVQELLRHRDLTTTMRYVAVNDEALRAAIAGLAA